MEREWHFKHNIPQHRVDLRWDLSKDYIVHSLWRSKFVIRLAIQNKKTVCMRQTSLLKLHAKLLSKISLLQYPVGSFCSISYGTTGTRIRAIGWLLPLLEFSNNLWPSRVACYVANLSVCPSCVVAAYMSCNSCRMYRSPPMNVNSKMNNIPTLTALHSSFMPSGSRRSSLSHEASSSQSFP